MTLELLVTCPERNAIKVADRLSYLMCSVPEDAGFTVPFKCDAEISYAWYGKTIEGEELEKMCK